jgi:hypothetical protein
LIVVCGGLCYREVLVVPSAERHRISRAKKQTANAENFFHDTSE